MAEIIGAVIGSAGLAIIVVGLLSAILLYAWLPYMAWSATRSLKGIHRELEALNSHVEQLALRSSPPHDFSLHGQNSRPVDIRFPVS